MHCTENSAGQDSKMFIDWIWMHFKSWTGTYLTKFTARRIDLNKVVYIETYSICKTWIITLYFYILIMR